MSLLPSTLLNASSNEDQTLEIHTEILEPLSHSQTLARWEIPHKNILDSDSILAWECNWELMTGGTAEHTADGTLRALPLAVAGLYNSIKRARLYVNGKIISELEEVGKYLTLKSNFQSHEHKTEISDFFSYADNDLVNEGGSIKGQIKRVAQTPGDKELGPRNAGDNTYRVECSLKLHQLFSVLKDAQLDTNSIHGKIMIEIDWNVNDAQDPPVWWIGTQAQAGAQATDRVIQINNPRLLCDFLTYNDEVQAQIKQTIFGDGPGVSMPYREVALVRKVVNANGVAGANTEDFAIGMTGRAVQKIYVAKVMNTDGNDANYVMGQCRSDLLGKQKWNVRVNDLMIFDRDVENRAEEFNYIQQTGEAQFTCPPATWERREGGKAEFNNYVGANDIWDGSMDCLNLNFTPANSGGANTNPVNKMMSGSAPMFDYNKVGYGNRSYTPGTAITQANLKSQRMGRQNYLAVNLAKYMKGAENPINAMRIGSTPVIFTLSYDGTNDANTTQKSGNLFFFVEYLKVMNLKNGEVNIADL